MATHDEQDVRPRTPRTRPILEVVPVRNTQASIAIPLTIAEGAVTGSRAGGLGALLGAAVGAGSYLYNNRDAISAIGGKMYTDGVRIYNKLASYFYPEEAPDPATQGESTTASSGATSAPSDTTATVAPGTTAPSPQPERNDSASQGRRPSFRERLGDRIAGRSSGQATGNSGGSTPPNNNQNGSFLGRMLWETKNNNFGQNYWQWRNVGRVGLGISYPAREHLWPAVGSAGKYMIMGPDSIPATLTPATSNTPSVPVDSGYVAKDQYIAPTDTLDF